MSLFPGKKLAILCFNFRGRRQKFIELQQKMFDDIRIFAKAEGYHHDIFRWDNIDQIKSLLEEYEPDIVHVYVDRTVLAAVSLQLGFPTITDMHDCAELRGHDDPFIQEVYSYDNPKLFSSPGLADYVVNKYKIKDHTIIPNLPLKEWHDFERMEKIGGENIVYFGGLTMQDSLFNYRYYEEIFKIFINAGIDVHVYPADEDFPGYEGLDLKIHPTVKDYKKLYSELSRYNVGFIGLNEVSCTQDYAKICLPNKAFDYMTARIPTLSFNIGYPEKYIKNWGICVNKLDDLVPAYYKAKEKKIDYDKWREKFYLEKYFNTLADIYDEHLKKPNIRKKSIKISVCMIVRNEEDNLARCLDSISDIADEIIIIDTGSIDDTMNIAKKYGARIYMRQWQNDFSYHRNQALKYAMGDWIIEIDADEELMEIDRKDFRNILRTIPDSINALNVKVRDVNKNGKTISICKRLKIFRNNKGIHYEGKVHNQLIVDGLVGDINLEYNHYGFDLSKNNMKNKIERTSKLLLDNIKKNPEDYGSYFNLMNLYCNIGDYEKGIKYGFKFYYLEGGIRITPESLYFSIFYTMSTAYCEIGDYLNAILWTEEGLKECPDDPDLNYALTQIGANLTVIGGEGYTSSVGKYRENHNTNRVLYTTDEYFEEVVKAQMIPSYVGLGKPEKAEKLIDNC